MQKEDAPLQQRVVEVLGVCISGDMAELFLEEETLNVPAELLKSAFIDCDNLDDLCSEETIKLKISSRGQDVIEVEKDVDTELNQN